MGEPQPAARPPTPNTIPRLRRRERCAAGALGRPGDGGGRRRARPRPLPYVVRKHGGPPGQAAVRHPPRRDVAFARAASGRGRPSSSAAATESRRGPSRPPTRRPTPSSPSARGSQLDVLASVPNARPERGSTSCTTGSTPTSTGPCPRPMCSSGSASTPSRPSVVFVGRITRQKGVPHLLRAALAFDESAQLVLLAGAPTRPSWRPRPRALSRVCAAERESGRLDRRDAPRGRRPPVPGHATVFVCPSIYEPLGIVNLEAMACETAVVASDVGGIPEVVDDGETGCSCTTTRAIRTPSSATWRGRSTRSPPPGPGAGDGRRRSRAGRASVQLGHGRSAHRRHLRVRPGLSAPPT